MIRRPTMTAGVDPRTPPSPWPWACLALAIACVVLFRIPLVLNAGTHLDSDLAVDGLTLLEAAQGHWRWHYPATPFIGSLPVLFSWPQAKVWGSTPITLVSGGVVAYGLVVILTFAMNLRAFGSSVATWGLVPLALTSTGTIWLSGRITGGHLTAAAWHAGVFALLAEALRKGGWVRSAVLGFWCGLGLFLDSMVLVSLAGVIVASARAWWSNRTSLVRTTACVLIFGLAMGLGIVPRIVGTWLDPHDAYRGQLEPDTRLDSVVRNARLLGLACLPRLAVGHPLPGLEVAARLGPDPSGRRGFSGLALGVSVVGLVVFGWSMVSLAGKTARDSVDRAIRWGLLASVGAVVAGFLVNRTIANSDNYRYLVTLLVPWSSGFGFLMTWVAARKPGGRWWSSLLALGFAGLMAADSARWYAGLGWVDSSGRPVRKTVEDPALAWLEAHPQVTSILGDYWDVYRLSFLTGGRVRGVPFSEYPERFPEIARSLPGGRPEWMIVRPGPVGPRYRARALAEGGREVERSSGLVIVQWPRGTSP